jgi:hypothetical protein
VANVHFNLNHFSNALTIWLGMHPSTIFFQIFLPPLLLDSAVRVDFFLFKKVWRGMRFRQPENATGVRPATATGGVQSGGWACEPGIVAPEQGSQAAVDDSMCSICAITACYLAVQTGGGGGALPSFWDYVSAGLLLDGRVKVFTNTEDGLRHADYAHADYAQQS